VRKDGIAQRIVGRPRVPITEAPRRTSGTIDYSAAQTELAGSYACIETTARLGPLII